MATLSDTQLMQETSRIVEWARPRTEEERKQLLDLMQGFSGGCGLNYTGEDSGVGNVVGRDGSSLPPLGVLSSFGSWESVASTVLKRAEQCSSFNSQSTFYDFIAWLFYRLQFSTIPFFSTFNYRFAYASISSMSLSQLIGTVRSLTGEYVTSAMLDQIVTSIKKIAQLAVENEGRVQKNSSLQQGVLSTRGCNLYAGTLRTTVVMEYKKGKGYEQINQQLTVTQDLGTLDFEMCKRQSSILFSWDGRDVEEWASKTSSASRRPNSSPAWD